MNGVTLLAAMLAAIHAQHSVHYATTTASGATKLVIVGDAARTTGKQEIAFTQSGTSGHVSVRVAGNTAYFRGDAFALRTYMGVPAANATKYAGDWVRVPKSATQYASIAAAVTLGSFAANLAVGGTVQKAKGGLTITTATGRLRLFLTPKHLPTRETGKGSGGTIAVSIGRWNEAVRVSAPAKTVPASVVFHAAPGA